MVFDTVILCSLTALAILLASPEGCYPSGTSELSLLFSRYAEAFGKEALFLSILAFALATALCWYYYGQLSFSYLFGKRKRALFAPVFFVSFISGLVINSPPDSTLNGHRLNSYDPYHRPDSIKRLGKNKRIKYA